MSTEHILDDRACRSMTEAVAFSVFSRQSFTGITGVPAPTWMRALLVRFFPITLLLCGSAHAEGGCPPGQMPNNAWAPAGSAESLASCVPIPHQAQTPAWESRWGAVATDNKGKFGIVTGQKTERLARKAALAECKQRGASVCTADFTFRNQCAVVVSSASASFAQGAPTEKEAESLAMPLCVSSDAGQCWVYYSGCSLPVRVR